MSHFLDRLMFFRKVKGEFADGHGQTTLEDRSWEKSYRQRWQHDKIVRSTHGVNCTGSCSWKIYVKDGLVTWETQQTDYPRTRPDLPNHEPRGCPRGASYSWYIYSANRLRYPMIRGRLLRLWRAAKTAHPDPVGAWTSIVENPDKAHEYKSKRGLGGLVRADWDEVNEIIAAANVYTVKKYGPDRVIGFSPIPAMSMVSYAAGARYLSLIGGVCLSFYDWYCDLPPSSPMTWGEQTDVPESADWYNSKFIIMWGSNVPQTRTPDAPFMTQARYNGTKVVVCSPDYAEATKFADLWLAPRAGTDAAMAMAMGHVILREFHLDNPTDYFTDYCRRYTDMPFLVQLEDKGKGLTAGRFLRAADFSDGLAQTKNPDWKTVAFTEADELVVPQGSIGFRWDDSGRWNLEEKEGQDGRAAKLRLSFIDGHDAVTEVAFPYFGGIEHHHFTHSTQADVLRRKVPVKRLVLADGSETLVATVYDLMLAHYGLDRGLDDPGVARSYDDDLPYTPAWQERITGVDRRNVIQTAREFADTAAKTQGRSMVILGAGINHWYHMDMNYRGIMNMLILCGCVGKSGGGWAHYVGQEKLRPQTGWLPVAFALDWVRPPRQMNGTSFFYAHTDQWRYESLRVDDLVSPLADPGEWQMSMIDCNVRAERMGWLPSAPQLGRNPLEVVKDAVAAGQDPKAYVVENLQSGALRMACEDPDDPANFPRNMFVWRSNLLGASGKGHEYFMRHLLGTEDGIQGEELGPGNGGSQSTEINWHEDAPRGKLDLLVTLDFRMSTTCLYSDIVLPTATWYEKDDLNTSDMHPFIHPLSQAVNPAWESRSDWDIFKGIAEKFSTVVEGHLGVEQDIVTLPLQHDTPGELGQPYDVRDWKRGECQPIPGKTMPNLLLVERDYPATYQRFISIGPLLEKLGNGGKGINWQTAEEVKFLGELNGVHHTPGANNARPKLETAIDAAEAILSLAPETNGHVAVKAWQALSRATGREHAHLALSKQDEKIRFRDIQAQPRKIISSPTWSGIESEEVCYTASYTNVHELIPWRTLTGRQQVYQDHSWMRAFGEGFTSYRPPVDTRDIELLLEKRPNGNKELVLNFLTPHQKWGIHSTYSDNLLMLTLSRGGPVVWLSEADARSGGIIDNDWIEVFNRNGALVARAVVSQRIPPGTTMMYHAQERIVNTPGSEITGRRGGIHNSVTRIVVKPTHMIGGYAQLSYGFNYYGPVGSNRDEFIILRKMRDVDWLEGDDASILAQEYTR
ncbi:MAG: nitrate reductase subunit alpha [Haliea sp.]|nr:nitrate reductase subunit alpha [Haliea sp.]